MPVPSADSGEAELYRRVITFCTRLEAANSTLYRSIRGDIQQGSGRHSLLRWVPKRSSRDGEAVELASGPGYDYLDELVSGVLQFEKPRAEAVKLAPEMVFYQPTPARHIFDLIDRAALTEGDVLVDLGSGMGHVPLLASICTDARCIGIELEPAYVECASASSNAEFENRNVYPAGREGSRFVRRHGLLSVHAVHRYYFARCSGLASTGSRQPRDSNLHFWPLHANHRRRAMAEASRVIGNGPDLCISFAIEIHRLRATQVFDRNLILRRLAAMVFVRAIISA